MYRDGTMLDDYFSRLGQPAAAILLLYVLLLVVVVRGEHKRPTKTKTAGGVVSTRVQSTTQRGRRQAGLQ